MAAGIDAKPEHRRTPLVEKTPRSWAPKLTLGLDLLARTGSAVDAQLDRSGVNMDRMRLNTDLMIAGRDADDGRLNPEFLDHPTDIFVPIPAQLDVEPNTHGKQTRAELALASFGPSN
jgi:hypothetical protein